MQQLLWGIYFDDELLCNGRTQFSWRMVFHMQENKYQTDLRAVLSSISLGFFSSITWISVVSNVIRPSWIILPYFFSIINALIQQIHFLPFFMVWLQAIFTQLQLPSLNALNKALFQHGEHYRVAGSKYLTKKTSVSRSEFLSILMRQIWKNVLVSWYGVLGCLKVSTA